MHVLIDVTNSCNLRCVFCPRSNSRPESMTAEDFRAVLSKIGSVTKKLQLSCAWEYSIARDAREIVEILGEYDIPTTTICTNANILSDDLARAIVRSRIRNFVVSIGETCKDTYERLRKGGRFDRVTANIRKLVQIKAEMDSPLPQVCANLTLVRSAIEELPAFLDLAHDLGIQSVSGRHLILNEGLDMRNEIIHDKAAANALIRQARERAGIHSISFSIPEYGEAPTPRECRAPWRQLYISSDAGVSVCPRIHRYALLGNLKTQPLEAILGGRDMRGLKREFARGQFSNPVCATCMAGKEEEVPIEQGF